MLPPWISEWTHDLSSLWTHDLGSAKPTDPYRPNTARVALYQIIIALVLGFSAFLIFSLLRVRYPKIYVANLNGANMNYLHSSGRQRLPRLPARSVFGWIRVVYSISEKQILDHAGLDAVVFLSFFKMCIRILCVCVLFTITIISPIRYKFTGRVDQDYPSDDEGDEMLVTTFSHTHTVKGLLWIYTVFTYVFTFVVTFFLFRQTNSIISMRQDYLGRQNSITDRTIKISGIPPVLRDEEDLRRHINSLGIGEVDRIIVVKEWTDLNNLFKVRRKLLRKLEVFWVEYLTNAGIVSRNDLLSSSLQTTMGEQITMGVYRDDPSEDGEIQDEEVVNEVSNESASTGNVSNEDRLTDSPSRSPTVRSGTNSPHVSIIEQISEVVGSEPLDRHRPQVRTGFLGFTGPRVDAISYYTDQLETVDAEILRGRRKDYAATSSAFVTMKSVAQAQMIAQAVLDPKVNHLITNLAPAPHDIRWDNLVLSRKERNARIAIVTVIIGVSSLLLVLPVGYLANLLNIKAISRIWPQLGAFLKQNKWAETLITGLLPTYLFTIMNMIVPFFYVWISRRQGFTSHSDEELSLVSKNFFYIFVNLFLVFTLFGTALLSETTKIAAQLAQSLRDLSLFYVDLIILQGLGIFPYKLLLLGNLIKFPLVSLFWCKTPRDQLRMCKPPVFNFGLQLPQPILIFIITIVYSVMSTKILTAGLIYFVIGFFVFKYQLLYACVHPPHLTGKVWPLVFRRITLGLLIFQLTMVGTLILQKAYICASFLAPLPFLTMMSLWVFQTNYIPLSIFIALRSIENGVIHQGDEESRNNEPTLDERRELNKTYDFPHLVESLDGPMVGIDGDDVIMIGKNGVSVKKAETFDKWDY